MRCGGVALLSQQEAINIPSSIEEEILRRFHSVHLWRRHFFWRKRQALSSIPFFGRSLSHESVSLSLA